jgi:Phosphopantetheine attachment site
MTMTNTETRAKGEIKVRALKEYISWMESLLERPVNAGDNFLDVGGHSMLAISLNERIQNQFGLTLSMEHLYNATLTETFFAAH